MSLYDLMWSLQNKLQPPHLEKGQHILSYLLRVALKVQIYPFNKYLLKGSSGPGHYANLDQTSKIISGSSHEGNRAMQ